MARLIAYTVDDLEEILDYYMDKPAFAFDTETIGVNPLDPRRNEVVWLSLATYGRSDVIPMGHPNGRLLRIEPGRTPTGKISKDMKKATKVFSKPPAQLERSEVFGTLKPLLFSDKPKVGHNIKFDLCSIWKYTGALLPGPYIDTQNAAYLINSSMRGQYKLGMCVKRELGFVYDKSVGKDIAAQPFKETAKYSRLDSLYTWLLWTQVYEPRIPEIQRVWDVESELIGGLCEMEQEGIPLDQEVLHPLFEEMTAEVEELRGKVYKAAGKVFDLGSPQQLSHVLYQERGLKPRKMTKGGKDGANPKPSTDAEALEYYRTRDPMVGAYLEWVDVDKLLGTYVAPYVGEHLVNGKIHASFNAMGAETGRFSSSNPNLQNVPRPGTEKGKKIRGLFYAPDDDLLVVADYSQVEPRVMAGLSRDPAMMRAYTTEGGDFYTAIADPFGLDRNAGKTLFLSVAYGIGPDTLAANIGIRSSRAKAILDDFDRQFPVAGQFKKQVIRDCRKRRPPHVTTLLGRRRYLPTIFAEDYGVKMRAERQAFNTVIQGGAADINKLAMLETRARLAALDPRCKMLLTVHDEIVTRVPRDVAEEAAQAVKTAMESIGGVVGLPVPLVADVKVVKRWSEAK